MRPSEINPCDFLAIERLLALCMHVVDEREWSRLDEIFTVDAVFDATEAGYMRLEGRDAIYRDWSTSNAHPLTHHVLNTVITPVGDDAADVVSKGISLFAGQQSPIRVESASYPFAALSVSSVTYRDKMVLTADGWRIAVRRGIRRHPDKMPAPN